MTRGIKISNGKAIDQAEDTDLTVDSTKAGGMKVHVIKVFTRAGDTRLINGGLGLNALIQRYEHGLGYVPAYIAWAGFGSVDDPDLLAVAYNNFVTVDGQSDFVHVDGTYVTVGFDAASTGADFIKVIVFGEKIADF